MNWGFSTTEEGRLSAVEKFGFVTEQPRVHSWLPMQRIAQRLPALPFECLTLYEHRLSDGTRIFLPAAPIETFIVVAQRVGLSILIEQNRLQRAKRNRYHFNWFLYQLSHHSNYYIRRSFRGPRDLLVTQAGRGSPRELNVLPWESSSRQTSESLPNVDSLIERGRIRAIANGISMPSNHQKICFGFIAVAETMRRSRMRATNITALIRSCLFSEDPTWRTISDRQVLNVRDRIGIAIGNHLDDATIKLFNAWIWGPSNSLVKQIGQQRKSRGGELDRDLVRQVIVELGWSSYASVAKCVEALMSDVRKLIRPKLTAREATIFDFLYLRQPCFGRLALIMLDKQLEFVGHQLPRMLERPHDSEQLSIFYQLLSFYSIMVDKRRAADRDSKRRGKRTREYLDFDQSSEDPLPEQTAEIRMLADAYARKHGIRCTCPNPNWNFDLGEPTDGIFPAVLHCTNQGCNFSQNVEITGEDFQFVVPEDLTHDG